MAVLWGHSITVVFHCWNKATGEYATGQANSITVRISRDGGALATMAEAPVELNSTNAPGAYKVTLPAPIMESYVVVVIPQHNNSSQYVCERLMLITDNSYFIEMSAQVQTIMSKVLLMQFDPNNRIIARAAVVDDKSNYTLASGEYANIWNTPEAVVNSGIGNRVKTNLDTNVGSRLEGSSYTPPDNTGIAAIKAQTDKLTFDTSNQVHARTMANMDKNGYTLAGGEYANIWNTPEADVTAGIGNRVKNNLDTNVASRLAASSYTPPDNTSIGAIKSKTDQLTFTSNNVHARVVVMADNVLTAAAIANNAITDTKIADSGVTRIAGGILLNPSQKLATGTNGYVTANLNFDQAVPGSPTAGTIGDAMASAARLLFDVNDYVYAVGAGGGGGSSVTDWTADERAQIRYVLGIDGLKVAPTGGGLISDIKSKTDKLTFDASNQVHARTVVNQDKSGYTLAGGEYANFWNTAEASVTSGIGNKVKNNLDTNVGSRLAGTSYTPPDNTGIAAIKAQTDKLTFDANNRVSARTAVNEDKSGYTLAVGEYTNIWNFNEENITAGIGNRIKSNLNVAVDSRLAATSYVAPDNNGISAIQSKTDKLAFDASDRLLVRTTTNDDKNGYSLTTAEHQSIANRVLVAPIDAVESQAGAKSLAWVAARILNRVQVSGTQLVVYKTDNTTTYFVQPVVVGLSSTPISEVGEAQ